MRSHALKVLALVATSALTAPVRGTELRINGAELATIVQKAFSGTIIRLHQQSPPGLKDPRSGSFVQLGPQLGRVVIPFAIPPHEFSLGPFGSARYYVNDVNSNPDALVNSPAGTVRMGQTITVGATPATFIVTIRFEDSGTEIKGVPLGRMERLKDETVPDVEINNIRLQILLYPAALPNGQITFKPSLVTFFGDIQARGVADLSLFGRRFDFLNELTNYKAEIKRAIEGEVKRIIDQNLNRIGSAIQSEAGRRGSAIGVRISGVRFEGTTLVVSGTAAL
ncbi:MAG TPA: hypothetical protein VNM92_14260 [Thermoanaerobaculia bacterium]|nr:hypothetical protein [Thermoanaerobaculia bacterium]